MTIDYIAISGLDALPSTALATGDLFAIVDVSEALDADKTKKISAGNLWKWEDYALDWTASTTNPDIGSGTLNSRYSRYGKLCTMSVRMVYAADSDPGAGGWRFSMPVTSANQGVSYVGAWAINDASGPTRYAGSVICTANSNYINRFFETSTNQLVIADGIPMTWAADDVLEFTITYEIN